MVVGVSEAIGGCESPRVGAGNRTWVLYRNGTDSESLNCLSSIVHSFNL